MPRMKSLKKRENRVHCVVFSEQAELAYRMIRKQGGVFDLCHVMSQHMVDLVHLPLKDRLLADLRYLQGERDRVVEEYNVRISALAVRLGRLKEEEVLRQIG